MGLLARVLAAGRLLLRDAPAGPADDPASWWSFWHGAGGIALSGQVVNARTATSLPVFTGCVALLSSALAAQRWGVERELPDGGSEAVSGPLDEAVATTSFATKERMLADMLTFGAGYATRSGPERSSPLVALPTELISVQFSDRLRYLYSDPLTGRQAEVPAEMLAILRYRNWGPRPWLGIPPLLAIGDSIGVALAARGLASAEFRNGTTLRGYLATDGKLDAQKAEMLRNRWRQLYSGEASAYGTPVLEQGLKYQEIQQRDFGTLQLSQIAAMTANDIAMAFGVPGSVVGVVIGDHAANLSRGSMIDDSRKLVSHCLHPLAVRVADAVGQLVLSPADRAAGLRVTINLESLVRGYGLELSEATSRYVLAGVLSRNEARRMLGFPGRPEADELLVPVNEEPMSAMQARQDRADAESAAAVDAAQQPATLSASEVLVLARLAADLRTVAANDGPAETGRGDPTSSEPAENGGDDSPVVEAAE